MENRLFLLQEPGQNFDELKDAILAGKDVTEPEAYTGKITLSQLNAYSGELTAEALTNFKTIKIEKDGSAYETNVAKLLLELQQGGGVEDAIEEAIIEIDSKKGDHELREDLDATRNMITSLHHVPESYTAGLSGEFAIAEEYKYNRWVPSLQEADGIRTAFISRDSMSKAGEAFMVVLNGVVVTDEDGSRIQSEFGSYYIGFEFNVAPSVGDVVEFFITRVAAKSARPFEEAISVNVGILDSNKDQYGSFEDDMATIKTQKESDKQSLYAEIDGLKDVIKELEESRQGAYESLVSASSIDEVKSHSNKVIRLDVDINGNKRDINELFSAIELIDKDLKSIDESIASETAEYERLRELGDPNAYQALVELFNNIANETHGDLA